MDENKIVAAILTIAYVEKIAGTDVKRIVDKYMDILAELTSRQTERR